MTNFQKARGWLGLTLIVFSTPLVGCTIWQSEGREFLEKQGLEFAASSLNNFISYQEQDCSTDPNSHPIAQVLTGDFKIVDGNRQWDLRTYSQEQGLGFQQHFVQIEPDTKTSRLYCYPIETEVPTRHLSGEQIQKFFATP